MGNGEKSSRKPPISYSAVIRQNADSKPKKASKPALKQGGSGTVQKEAFVKVEKLSDDEKSPNLVQDEVHDIPESSQAQFLIQQPSPPRVEVAGDSHSLEQNQPDVVCGMPSEGSDVLHHVTNHQAVEATASYHIDTMEKSGEARDEVDAESQSFCRVRNPHGIEGVVVELLSDGVTIMAKMSHNRVFSWERTRGPPLAYSKFVTEKEFDVLRDMHRVIDSIYGRAYSSVGTVVPREESFEVATMAEKVNKQQFAEQRASNSENFNNHGLGNRGGNEFDDRRQYQKSRFSYQHPQEQSLGRVAQPLHGHIQQTPIHQVPSSGYHGINPEFAYSQAHPGVQHGMQFHPQFGNMMFDSIHEAQPSPPNGQKASQHPIGGNYQ